MANTLRRRTVQDFGKIPVLGLVPESNATAPSSPANGQLWVDSSASPPVLRYYNGTVWIRADQVGAELSANKGVASGYASLDAGVKVPIAQIPTGQTGTTVPLGNDARFTDTRVPTDGSVTGGTAGAGVKIAATTITAANIVAGTLTDTQVAAANKDGTAGTASLRTLGTGALQATAGNDSRLSDTRTPTAGSVVPASFNATAIDAAAGVASARTLGTGALQALAGNTRLDQLQTPTSAVAFGGQRATNGADPTTGTDLATKNYVDGAIQGFAGSKEPIRVVLTTNVNLAAPGATLDSVSMVAGDRFGAFGQTTTTQNGIYVWNGAAVPATRSLDTDATGEVKDGTLVSVSEGSGQNPGSIWQQQATPAGAPGAWTQTWTKFQSAFTYTPGNGIDITAFAVSVKKDTTDATNPIAVSANGVGLTTVPIDHGGTGATTAAAARTALSAPGIYTALLGAMTAGVEYVITHSLGNKYVHPVFTLASDDGFLDLGWRYIDATTMGVTTDNVGGYGANAVRAVVIG